MFELEDRLIDFAVRIVRVAESLPKTRIGSHIAGHLTRCGTSPAPNCGGAQGAESRADFIHKMKVCLKELRETRGWLLMIVRAKLSKTATKLGSLVDENNELSSIFVSSIKTAKERGKKTSSFEIPCSVFDIQFSLGQELVSKLSAYPCRARMGEPIGRDERI